MTDAEIEEAFGAISPDWPIWKAIIELLDQNVDEVTEAVTLPALPDHVRQFHAGRLNNAILFRNDLRSKMDAIHSRKPTA